jgi:hypothetical protein
MQTAVTFNNMVRGKPRTKWLLIAAVASFWLPTLFGLASEMFDRAATSRSVVTRILAEPYVGSDSLKYQWSGEVYRSCEVTITRSIVDANSYVHTISPTTFPALDPEKLGAASFPIKVQTPPNLPEGVATYLSGEISKCGWFQKYVWPAVTDYPPLRFTVTFSDPDRNSWTP